MLGDPASSAAPFLGPVASGASTPLAAMPNVPWLRKTEYLSREGSTRAALSQDLYVPTLSARASPPRSVLTRVAALANKTKTTRLTSHATRNCETLRRPSLRLRTPTLRHYDTPRSLSLPPSRRLRSSQTQKSGQTHMICSGSLRGQEIGHRMFVLTFLRS